MKYCRKLARLNNITYASSYLITVCLIMQRSSSSSFEVSAIFGMVILMTFVAMLGICGIASRNFISTSVVYTVSGVF